MWINRQRPHFPLSVLVALAVVLVCRAGRSQASASRDLKRSTIVLTPHQLPLGAKITDFTMSVSGGMIDSVSRLPPGWGVRIDNPSRSASTFEGHAGTGGAAIDEATFDRILIYLLFSESAAQPRSVDASFTVLNSTGVSRVIPLSSYSFEFEDVFTRRRLPVPRD